MLIADDFIFIHLPKTGGTFVTHTLRSLLLPSRVSQKIHSARRAWGLKLPGYPYRYVEQPKHSMRRHIRPEHADRTVLTCVRNPLDLYVSHFKFGWWRENRDRWFSDTAAVEAGFGPIDDLDFNGFVRATQQFSSWRVRKQESDPDQNVPGRMSLEWIHYFCKSPDTIFAAYPDMDAVADQVRKQLTGVRVLRMENLNDDLADFLSDHGFSEQQVKHVRSHPKVFPGRRTRSDDDDHLNYYDDSLLADVRQWESILLHVFYGTQLAPVPK